MGHEVRSHPRRLGNGRSVTVQRHQAADPGGGLSLVEQRKRDRLEQRAVREHQQARITDRFGPQTTERKTRRRSKRGPSPKGARARARKAVRKMRKHKVLAVLMLGMAGAELGLWAAAKGGRKAWGGGRKAWQASASGIRRLRASRAERKATAIS
jgi:hypothetical protein